MLNSQVQSQSHPSRIYAPSHANISKPLRRRSCPPRELKVIWLGESHPIYRHAETPVDVALYWRSNIPEAPWFDPAKECLVALVLNRRNKIIAHNLVSIGTLDSCLFHAREVFRPVIAAAGSALILTHNHPSGDPTPSHADLMATNRLIHAGDILGLELVDHIVIGDIDHAPEYVSLRRSGLCDFPNARRNSEAVQIQNDPINCDSVRGQRRLK